MRRLKKKISIMLTMALIFNMLTGISVSADETYEGVSGFCIAGTGWRDDGFEFALDINWFSNEWETEMGNDNWISLGMVEHNGDEVSVSAVTEGIYITDEDDNIVTEDVAVIKNTQTQWNDESQQDEEILLPDGVYCMQIYAVGTFRIHLEGEDDYIKVYCNKPFVALYDNSDGDINGLIALPYRDFEYEAGATYYLVADDERLAEDSLNGADIEFSDVLLMDNSNLKWEDNNYEPIEINVPQTLVGDWWNAIRVIVHRAEMRYNEEYEEDRLEEWEEYYEFNFRGDEEGLVLSGVDWRDVGGIWSMVATDPEEVNAFHKDWTSGVKDANDITIGIKNGDTIDLVSKEDIDNLYIADIYGERLDTSLYEINVSKFDYWQGDNQIWNEVDGVFNIKINKVGDYRIVYEDGDVLMMAMLSVNMPTVSVYGKKVVDENYCLGGDVSYNSDRNTFYIMVHTNEYDWDSWGYRIKKGSYAWTEGDMDNVKVSTDKDAGVVTVQILNGETADVEVRVFLIEEHILYEEIDGQRVEREREDTREEERNFFFRYTDEELKYSAEVEDDITAANAVIDLINELPDAVDVKVADEEKIANARAALENLTESQLALVDNSYKDRLSDIENALLQAKEDKEINDADMAAAQSVIDSITNLPNANNIKATDEDSINEAREKYDALTDNQKALVDRGVYSKLVAAESALPYVKQIDALNETISDLEADIENANDQIDSLTDAKSELENTIEEKEQAIANANEAIENLEATNTQLNNNIETLTGQINELKNQKEELEGSLANANDNNELLRQTIEEYQRTVATLKTAYAILENAKKELEEINQTLAEANEAITKANEDLTKTNEDLTKANKDLVKNNEDLTKANNELKLQNESGADKSEDVALPKVGDILNDSISKATYKILTVGSDSKAGTVEYSKPNSSAKKVVIPTSITVDGKTYMVTAIGDNAFKGDKKLKTLVISEGITKIGKAAFAGCKKLKKITVKTTVLKKINKGAFKNVSKKVKVKVPSEKKKKYKKLFKKGGIKANRVK